MSGQGTTALHFEPPGPGSWDLDPVHFPRPVTRYWAEMHPEPFRRGTHEFMAFYGTPLGGMETAYVNGFAYHSMRPAPDEEIPQRFARAEEVWERKVWREQLREWDETFKPAAIKTHRELQSVDADALSDDALVEYLTRCREHHSQMIFQHMRFTGSAMLPVGDLLAHLGAWTDVAPADTLAMLRGAAPVSAGASGELERLIAAITNDPAARALLDSDGDPGKTLAELRAFGGDVGPAMSAYLDLVGCRLLDGFDIAGRYALELPDVLLRSIRSSVDGAGNDTDEVDARIADIRSQVPDEHRARVRRAARRGAPHVPPARRAGRLQRHLGVGHHAPGGARGRPPARGQGPRPRRRALRRRRLRRDVRARDRRGRAVGRRARAALRRPQLAHRQGGAGVARAAAAPAARPVGSPARRRPGHARGRHRVGRAVRQLGGARTRRTCCAGSPRAAACTKGRPGASRARPSSIASCRATCSSPSRRPRRSTSCCRCSARSSPTPAVCSRTRRSWRASTASPAWSGRATRPTSSPTARGCESTATPGEVTVYT